MSDPQTENGFRDGLPEDDDLAAVFNRGKRRRPRPDRGSTPAGTETPPVSSPVGEETGAPQQPRPPAEPEPADNHPIPVQAAPEPEPPAAAGGQIAVRAAAPPASAPPAAVAQPAPQARPLTAYTPPPGTGARRTTIQCTVNVSVSVRERFTAYQTAKRVETGREPTNAVVVRRAVLRARKEDSFAQMREYVRHRRNPVLDEDDDDPDGLFGEVEGRRTQRGRVKDTDQLPFRPSEVELEVIDALAAAQGFANRSEFLDAALDAFLPPLPDKRRR